MRPRRFVPAVFALALLGFGGPLLAQQSAEELYQAALYQEEVQGSLQQAIDQFSRILMRFPDNRTVGAKAQLHIGLCYEKLGQQEARQAYRRVIADFPEHPTEVAVARERLAGIERSAAERNRVPVFRKVEIPSRPQNGVLSPSGDSLAFVSQGSLWVVPLHSEVGADVPGEPEVLAKGIGAWDMSNLLSWAGDGKWIAVNSEDPDPDGSVYIVPVDGGRPRVLPMPPRGGHAYSYRLGLSPHGESVAFSALGDSPPEGASARVYERYVYSTSTAGGEPRQLTSDWGRTPAFSPDGELVAFVGFGERDDRPRDTTRGQLEQLERGLWVVPSAGGAPIRLAITDGTLAGPVWSPDGRFIAVRDEPFGNNSTRELRVYPLNDDRSGAGEPLRITLPRASLDMIAGWTTDDELGVFMHSESHEAIYTVPSSGGKAVQVSPETEAPLYPRWSADGERIYFRRLTRDSGVQVTVGQIPSRGGDISDIPVQSDRHLVARYPGGGASVSPDGRRLVFSAYEEPYRPEEGVDLWVIPLDGRKATRLTRDRGFEGYPVWTPDGEWVVFLDRVTDTGDVEDSYSAVFRIPASGGEQEQLTSREDSVAEGPIAVLPDDRRIAFLSNGAFKTIPVTGGKPELLLDAPQANEESDLAWSPDGSRIAYSGAGKIWIAPGDGSGPPVELRTGLPAEARHDTFSWSPDGTRIAFYGGIGGEDELWLISDFLPKEAGR